MTKTFVKILELLGDHLEVCVSVYEFSFEKQCFIPERYNRTLSASCTDFFGIFFCV